MKKAVASTVLMLPAFVLLMLSIHAGAYGTPQDTQFYVLSSLAYIAFLGVVALVVTLIDDLR